MAIGLAAALSLFANGAAADPERNAARLEYRSIESTCPDEASFRRLVAARLGFDPFDAGAPDDVVVEIAPRHGRLEGRVEITRAPDPTRVRALTVDRGQCGSLATALATTVAVALDTVRPPLVEPVAPAPEPTAPAAVTTDDRAAATTLPPASLREWELLAFVGSSASAALGPAPMLGPEAGAAFRAGRVSIEASMRAETTLGSVSVANGERVDASVYSAGLTPCAHAGAFAGCAFGRFGSFNASSPDVAKHSPRDLAFGAIGARVTYALSFSPALSVRTALEAGIPLVRTSLGIDGSDVWVAPPVFFGASLSLLAKIL